MFPASISSDRVRVESATSAIAEAAPAAGAWAIVVGPASSGSRPLWNECCDAPSAAIAPGEAPSPALPGAAPSCGPGGVRPGRDWEAPASPPPVGSIVFGAPRADEHNEFAAQSARLGFLVRTGPLSLGGPGGAGGRARRLVPPGAAGDAATSRPAGGWCAPGRRAADVVWGCRRGEGPGQQRVEARRQGSRRRLRFQSQRRAPERGFS